MNKTKYLTTPIFYANSVPHIGHLYTGLICDLWKQINKVMGENVLLSSGMDEHGQKVFQSAQNLGINEQQHVDAINQCFVDFFNSYHIRYDRWVRTTDADHKKSAQLFWAELSNNGYIYKGRYQGWYSISDENYLEVPENYISNSDNIVWREEDCYYFKLSHFQNSLLEYYERNHEAIYPRSRYNETIGFIKQGLKDFSVSRPKQRLSWGVEVPDDPDQVMYVWVDALANYLSLVGYPDPKFNNFWPPVHVIGKDILKFHTVYWPAMLMAADLELPRQVIVHGWWLNGEKKVSKSLNNAIDVAGLSAAYGSDSVRYFLLSNMTLGEDANFKESLFHFSVNATLSNKFGNLLSRLLGMAQGQKLTCINVCDLDTELGGFLKSLITETNQFVKDITFFDEYIGLFSTALDFLNNYISENSVWKKSGKELERCLYSLLHCFRVVAVVFSPIIPEAAEKIARYFDIELTVESASKYTPIEIKEMVLLFPRVLNDHI